MERLTTLFTQSCKELKRTRTITVCSMLAALAIVLGNFSIPVGDSIKLGVSGIPNRLVDYLFGPVVGGCFGGALDVIKYVIKPSGAFFPGFTFNAVLAGVIYGCFFYQKKFSLWRIFIAKFIVMLLCNVLLNTLWISMLSGKGFMLLIPARLIKNIISWPFESALLYLVGETLEIAGAFRIIKGSSPYTE